MSYVIWNLDTFKKTLDKYMDDSKTDEIQRDFREGGTILEMDFIDFKLFNPNTISSPSFRREIDYNLIKRIFLRFPILIKRDKNQSILSNPWNISFHICLTSSTHSKFLKTKDQLERIKAKAIMKNNCTRTWDLNGDLFLPIYVGGSIWLYDHRFNEIIPKLDKSKKEKANFHRVSVEKKKDPLYSIIPMYWAKEDNIIDKYPQNWIQNWFLVSRRISGPSVQRTFIISIIPKLPTLDSIRIITFKDCNNMILCLIANLSSIIFDYIVRNKLTGNSIGIDLIEQLPVIHPNTFSKGLYNFIKPRVLELLYTNEELKEFAQDFGLKQNPFLWNTIQREKFKAELDAMFALLYGINKQELGYILDTFYVLRDIELKKYGEYKTKNLVLEAYDKFNTDPELGPLFRLEGIDLEKLKGE